MKSAMKSGKGLGCRLIVVKHIAIALFAGCSICFVSGCANEEYAETINGIPWVYRIIDGKVQLGNSGCTNVVPRYATGGIFVPSHINSMIVDTICENAFLKCNRIIAVVLPDTLVECSAYAFRGCSSLKAVYFHGDKPSCSSYTFLETGSKDDAYDEYESHFPILFHQVGKKGWADSDQRGYSFAIDMNSIPQAKSAINEKLAAINLACGNFKEYFDAYHAGKEVLNLLTDQSITEVQREESLHAYDDNAIVIGGTVFGVDKFGDRAVVTLQGETGSPWHRAFTVMVTSKADNQSEFKRLNKGEKISVRGKVVFNVVHGITDAAMVIPFTVMYDKEKETARLKDCLVALDALETLCNSASENP